MNKETFLKVRYTISTFDVDAMCSHSRRTYELFPDGKIVCSHYEKGIRKAIEKYESHNATADDFQKLCDELDECMNTADRQEWYVDDCSAEVKIYRQYGRVDTMDRGYGNAETDIGRIITNYIYAIAGMHR